VAEESEAPAEETAAELEVPTPEQLVDARLLKFKHPKTKEWYLRTNDEPKRCYLGGVVDKDNDVESIIAKAWANFKAGNCAGIWEKGEVKPEQRSNAAASAGGE
jgi:hypothetical protein